MTISTPMRDVAKGRGCHRCEVGVPVERIESRRGKVLALCLECVLLWFPGRTVGWWEGRHAPFLNHVDMVLRRSTERAREEWAKWTEEQLEI